MLEAKPEGTALLGVVNRGADYACAAPARYPAGADPLPFVCVSTGAETLFQDARDPQARPRRLFASHRPETLRAMLQAGSSLRARLAALPPLDAFTPAGTDLKSLEECTVQHLQGSASEPSAGVVPYSVLCGQPLDEAEDERGGFQRGADEAERPVAYSRDIPPGTVDLTIVDE